MNNKIGLSLRSFGHFVLGVCLAAVAGTASAVVLYEQSPVDNGDGYYANGNAGLQFADDFALGGPVSLKGITWWGGYDAQGTGDLFDDDFLVRIYSGGSGVGAQLLEVASPTYTRVSTNLVDSAKNAVFQYGFALAQALDLTAGTFYLSIQNKGSSDWFWLASASGGGGLQYWLDTDQTWDAVDPPANVAFSLTGDLVQIPEPATTLLLLAGAALLPVRRRRHDRRP
jgi:hypothetical protein